MGIFNSILVGEDFRDKKYFLTSLEKAKETFKNPKNLRFFINNPVELLEPDAETGYTGKNFKEIRGIFIDIDPEESKREILKIGGNFQDWNNDVSRVIEIIKSFFMQTYGKMPTMIISSGKGIQILLELEEPITRFDEETLRKYTFIFRLLDTVLPKEFEIDPAMYKLNTKNAWNNISIKRAKLPIKQEVVKYINNDKTKGVSYQTSVFDITLSESTFNLNEMIIKEKEYLLENISFTGVEVEIDFKDAIAEVVDEIRTNYLPRKQNEKFDKIMGVRCLFPEHSDVNPSGVFFKESGVFYCSTCQKGIPFKEVYHILKGEELKTKQTTKIINFTDLPKVLSKYTQNQADEISYCFEINGEDIWLKLDDWTDSNLRSMCATYNILGYKDKLKQDVLDAITKRKSSKEIPLIKSYYPQITSDLIILGKNRCFVNTEKGWRQNYSIDVSNGFEFDDDEMPEDYKQRVYNQMYICNKPHYNLFAISIVLNSLMMSEFEKAYKIHPLMYVYGVKDTGKSSIVNFALSIIIQEYEALVSGASTEHTLLFMLMHKDYLPVLIDEFLKFSKIMNKLIQMLKDIATSGGKYVKGTIHNSAMYNEYSLKATPILASEYREDSIDPSFYQRCIELNLNNYPAIDSKKSIQFNKLLLTNKTFIFKDLLNYTQNIQDLEEDFILKKYPEFDYLSGKKRLSVYLQIISIYNSYLFLKSVGLDYSNEYEEVIRDYIKNEVMFNSKESRTESVTDQCLLTLIQSIKFNLPVVASSVRIEPDVSMTAVTFKTSRAVLMSLGFKNEHKLNEIAIRPERTKSTLRKSSAYVNVSFTVEIESFYNFIKMIMESDRDGYYGKAISLLLGDVKAALKIDDDEFIDEFGDTVYGNLPMKAKNIKKQQTKKAI